MDGKDVRTVRLDKSALWAPGEASPPPVRPGHWREAVFYTLFPESLPYLLVLDLCTRPVTTVTTCRLNGPPSSGPDPDDDPHDPFSEPDDPNFAD
ncbi:MAG TPA: hypothetical protein VKE40_24060 [Gemmataceae bacterium]|nr:hypothetical protein [Gemmataceae bacterium]